jgi:hypothetical protein
LVPESRLASTTPAASVVTAGTSVAPNGRVVSVVDFHAMGAIPQAPKTISEPIETMLSTRRWLMVISGQSRSESCEPFFESSVRCRTQWTGHMPSVATVHPGSGAGRRIEFGRLEFVRQHGDRLRFRLPTDDPFLVLILARTRGQSSI